MSSGIVLGLDLVTLENVCLYTFKKVSEVCAGGSCL
jgi:hypothetical protein